MADGQEAEEIRLREARDWPYAQRVADRNWKIRRDAYVDAKAASQRGIVPESSFGEQFTSALSDVIWHYVRISAVNACSRQQQPMPSTVPRAGTMLAKGLGDANAAAQDAALEALQSYLANSDEAQAAQCAPFSLHACTVAAIMLTAKCVLWVLTAPPAVHRIAESACANIAAKVLKQRVHTVAKATEVCLAFIELEQGEAVVVSWLSTVCGGCRTAALLAVAWQPSQACT
jgi:hypothetical protein